MFLALSMMTADIGKTKEKFLTDMYCRYYGLMKMYALKVVADENIAEDMVHEACIRLIGHVEKLQQMNEPVLVSYLRTTVRRVSLNYIASAELMLSLICNTCIGNLTKYIREFVVFDNMVIAVYKKAVLT